MINIAQPNPLAWPQAVSGATAPVAAVAAIRPLQETARNGQPGANPERESSGARTERRADTREGARPARDAGADDLRRSAATTERGEAGDVLARREAEQVARQRASEQAAEEARRAQRQELLTNVWKASAAVVDRVLGRDDAAGVHAVSASAAAPAPGRQPGEQLALPWPVMPQDALSGHSRSEYPAPQDVLAYDERGNSNLATLEAGVLLSRRV